MKPKANKNAHTPNTKFGMGDYYGTGVKAKLGRIIEGEGQKPVTPQALKKPPKSVV